MKKLLITLIALFSICSVQAQSRTDSEGNTVYHPFFAVAQYQIVDFDFVKPSSSYGLGVVASSISHWGKLHVGANVNIFINAGFVDKCGLLYDFGPSVRMDLSDYFFINIPINAMCAVSFPENSTDTETNWGAKIAPAIHGFITERLGLFAGPQVTFGSNNTSIGMLAGISYSF